MAEQDCSKCDPGLPPWMATFADMMALLMCFFVLLLSFAEIDAIRFKNMAESMKDAFGVQREIPANEIVKGVSVIKQEWSPSTAEQSVINEIRQETSDVEREYAKVDGSSQAEIDHQEAVRKANELVEKQLSEQFEELQKALEQELNNGLVALEREERKIIVRIQEKGSFASGSARLDDGFHQVMERISAVLASSPGHILVAGHSDNIPIRTGRFRSNWELSSARAVTVLHSMLRNKDISEDRVVVQGFADTVPQVPNDSAQNRARNRRVELVLMRGEDLDGGVMRVPDKAEN